MEHHKLWVLLLCKFLKFLNYTEIKLDKACFKGLVDRKNEEKICLEFSV